MDFGLSDDQTIFQETLRRYLSERMPLERVRAIMESDSGHDPALFEELAAQGVAGVMIGEEHGGSGLGLLDAAIAAEELGAAATPVAFHSGCVMASVALSNAAGDEIKRRWLVPAAAGKTVLTFAAGAPAVVRGVLDGSARFVPDAAVAEAVVVEAGAGDDARLLLVPSDTPGVSIEPLATIDDTRRVGEIVFDGVRIDDRMHLEMRPGPAVARVIDRILDAGRIALAADALGAAERSLERAVAYALERKQFDRVIGSFQAVKHMCAEVAAEIEPVRSLLWYAAFAWDEQRDDAEMTAAALKAHATEVATRATTTCLQVFGGMGFTYECDIHIWFKRAGFDRQMLGGPAEMRERAARLAFG